MNDRNVYVASTGYAQIRSHGSAAFVYYLVGTDAFQRDVLRRCSGSNYPAIAPSDLAQIKIPWPLSTEQKKIAECLQSLDELIAAEAERLEALQRYKKGLLQQLFPAEGETTPRLRFPQFRTSSEWGTSPLESVLAKSFYGTSSATGGTGKYPVLRIGNMQDGSLRLEELAYIDLTSTEFASLQLIQGDLLLNRTNSIDLVGRVSLFELQDNFVCASYIVVLRPDQSKADPSFCNYFLTRASGGFAPWLREP